MTENQRLKNVIEALGFTKQKDFAEAVGLKQGSLSDVLREKRGVSVSANTKSKLEKSYNLNLDWLETGEGDMFKNIEGGKEELGPNKSDHCKTLTNQKKAMPMYDTVTNASSLEVYNDINKEEPAFYVDIPQFKDCNFGKKIFGQSMEGSYCSGSYVFCREVFDHSIILFGEVYYFETEDYCMIKRLQKGSNEDCILACSDNEECRKDGSLIYQPIEIQKDKIRKLYIVKGAFIQTQH